MNVSAVIVRTSRMHSLLHLHEREQVTTKPLRSVSGQGLTDGAASIVEVTLFVNLTFYNNTVETFKLLRSLFRD